MIHVRLVFYSGTEVIDAFDGSVMVRVLVVHRNGAALQEDAVTRPTVSSCSLLAPASILLLPLLPPSRSPITTQIFTPKNEEPNSIHGEAKGSQH